MRALLVLSLVSLSACGWENVALAAHGRFEKTASIEAFGTFHLENVNGRVTVEPWSQNEVRIEAEKSASSEGYLQEIKIDVQGEGNRVDVKTRFPRDGIFGSGGHGRVDYLIRLPAGVRVEVRTVNGEVQVDAIDGAVQASTVNGTVRVTDSAGAVDASTVNGNIRAGYRKLAQSGHHSYTTVNGSVTLYLPSEVGGEFEASTVNGGISTDFPLEVNGKFGPRHLRGRIGDGRASFRIRTVNGGVKLLKEDGKSI